MDKLTAYQQILSDLDKKCHVPIERSNASDAKLTDILLSMDTDNGRDDRQTLATAAINAYYKKRPITFRTLICAQEELERSTEGQAFLLLDSSTSALVCHTAAVASAIVGVYEIAALCAAAGAYHVYNTIRVAKSSKDVRR